MPTNKRRASVIITPELEADYEANKQENESVGAFLLRRAGYDAPKHGGKRDLSKRRGKRKDR